MLPVDESAFVGGNELSTAAVLPDFDYRSRIVSAEPARLIRI